jgi:hypothetical protein
VKIQSGDNSHKVTVKAVTAGGGHLIAQGGDEGNTIDLYLTGDYLEMQYSGSNYWQVVSDNRRPHICELSGNSGLGQSFTAGATDSSDALVSLGTTVFDYGGLAGANKITVKRDGRYFASGRVGVTDQRNVAVSVRLYVNGSVARKTEYSYFFNGTAAYIPGVLEVNTVFDLSAGDYVQLYYAISSNSTGSIGVDSRPRLSLIEQR